MTDRPAHEPDQPHDLVGIGIGLVPEGGLESFSSGFAGSGRRSSFSDAALGR